MRKTILIITLVAGAIITGVISCESSQAGKHSASTIGKDSLLKRGEYLVTIGGCDDCHSPKKFGAHGPEVDMDRRFSGYPANRPLPKYDSIVVKNGLAMFNEDLTSTAGPWGVSFAT